MVCSQRRFGAAVLLGLAVSLVVPALAHAQRFVPPRNYSPSNLGPFPGLLGNLGAQIQFSQNANNIALLGRAFQNVPPYALGFNPYQQNFGYGYGVGGFNPYAFGGGGAGLYTNPYGLGGAYGMGSATLSTGPYGPGMGATLDPYGLPNPYSGNPYQSYYPDPYGGYLRGVADVITAQGNYLQTKQRARLVNEEVKRSQLDTRRKILDEARYERMQQPTAEDIRLAELEVAYNRARRSPPNNEIWSGKSLNDMLGNLVRLQNSGQKGPNIPLDEDILKHINLKVAGGAGNVGLLKGEGNLDWPLSLQDAKFADSRKRLGEQMDYAVQQVKLGNRVEAGRLKDMKAELERLTDALDRNVAEIPPTKYIEAMRFVNQLNDAQKALEDKKVSDLVSQAWIAKTKNVAELVKYLGANGLEFAPAVGSGNEAAYRALHAAIAAFDSGIAAVAKAPATADR